MARITVVFQKVQSKHSDDPFQTSPANAAQVGVSKLDDGVKHKTICATKGPPATSFGTFVFILQLCRVARFHAGMNMTKPREIRWISHIAWLGVPAGEPQFRHGRAGANANRMGSSPEFPAENQHKGNDDQEDDEITPYGCHIGRVVILLPVFFVLLLHCFLLHGLGQAEVDGL